MAPSATVSSQGSSSITADARRRRFDSAAMPMSFITADRADCTSVAARARRWGGERREIAEILRRTALRDRATADESGVTPRNASLAMRCECSFLSASLSAIVETRTVPPLHCLTPLRAELRSDTGAPFADVSRTLRPAMTHAARNPSSAASTAATRMSPAREIPVGGAASLLVVSFTSQVLSTFRITSITAGGPHSVE